MKYDNGNGTHHDLSTIEGMSAMIRQCGMRTKVTKDGIRITYHKATTIKQLFDLFDGEVGRVWEAKEKGIHLILSLR